MGVASKLNAVHVEGFPLLPVGTAEQAIESGNGEIAVALQKYLDAHFFRGFPWGHHSSSTAI